jgi:hypothetical protein
MTVPVYAQGLDNIDLKILSSLKEEAQGLMEQSDKSIHHVQLWWSAINHLNSRNRRLKILSSLAVRLYSFIF